MIHRYTGRFERSSRPTGAIIIVRVNRYLCVIVGRSLEDSSRETHRRLYYAGPRTGPHDMADCAEELIDLLDGDFVRLELGHRSFDAEVIEHDREPYRDGTGKRAWEYTIRFMPVGASAETVDADQFRVDVRSPSSGELTVGTLKAETYDEERLDYVTNPLGELKDVRPIDMN